MAAMKTNANAACETGRDGNGLTSTSEPSWRDSVCQPGKVARRMNVMKAKTIAMILGKVGVSHRVISWSSTIILKPAETFDAHHHASRRQTQGLQTKPSTLTKPATEERKASTKTHNKYGKTTISLNVCATHTRLNGSCCTPTLSANAVALLLHSQLPPSAFMQMPK